MKKGLLVVIIFVVILVLLVVFNFTGFVVKEDSEKVSRHIFYNSLRAEVSENNLECFPAHQIMQALPDNKCCEGLKQLAIYDEAEEDCSASLTGVIFCSNCGNQLCEYGENECNCPEDCNKPEKRL